MIRSQLNSKTEKPCKKQHRNDKKTLTERTTTKVSFSQIIQQQNYACVMLKFLRDKYCQF